MIVPELGRTNWNFCDNRINLTGGQSLVGRARRIAGTPNLMVSLTFAPPTRAGLVMVAVVAAVPREKCAVRCRQSCLSWT